MTIKSHIQNKCQKANIVFFCLVLLGLAACSGPSGLPTPAVTVPSTPDRISISPLFQKSIGSGNAETAAWSPDGKILAIGTSLQIDLYDSATMQLTATLASDGQSNDSLAFSPDGNLLAASAQNGMVQIWDVAQQRVLQTLENKGYQYGPQPTLIFSPDGKKLFVGADQTINVWDIGSGALLDSFPGQTNSIVGLALNREGTLLLAAGSNFVSARNLTTREFLYQHIEPDGKESFAAIFLGLDGKHFTTVSYTDNIGSSSGLSYQSKVSNWDLESGKLIDTFNAASDIIYSVALSADQKRIALGGWDGASVWDVDKKAPSFSKNVGKRVRALAVSPDGVHLLTIGSAGVQRWDLGRGKLLHTFDAYTTSITDAAFSPDGRLVAVSEGNYKVQLRSLPDGKLLHTFDGNFPLAFSADGKTLAFATGMEQETPMNEYSYNREIVLVDTSSEKKLTDKRMPCRSASAVAFSPDGHQLAFSGQNCPLEIRDPQSWNTLQTLGKDDYGSPESLLFGPDNRKLIVRKYRTVEIWDAQSATLLKTIEGIEYGAQMTVSPDGRFLAISAFKAGETNSLVQVWDLSGNQLVLTLDTLQNQLRQLAFSPDGQVLAISSVYNDQGHAQVEFWNAFTGQPLDKMDLPSTSVVGLAFSPDGKTLWVASDDGAIRAWQPRFSAAYATLATPTLIPTQTATLPAPIITMKKIAELGKGFGLKAYRSPDGKLIAQVDGDTLKWFDAKTFAPIGSVKVAENPSGYLLFSPGSKLVVSDTYYGGQIIDLVSQSVLGSVKGDNGYASDYVFTKDDEYMAYLIKDRSTSGPYHRIGLWDVTKRQEASDENTHYFPTLPQSGYDTMSAPAISPDGKLVAAGHSDKHVYVWSLPSRENRFILEGHSAFVSSVDFSPDGQTLASASQDGTVRLWNMATGKLMRVLAGFQDDIQTIHFSKDGGMLEVQVANFPLQTIDLRTGTLKSVAAPTVTPDPFETQRYQQGYVAGHTYGSGQVLYSPDGRLLALAYNNVLVWDIASGALLASLGDPQQGEIRGMAFSANGSRLAVTTNSGDVQVWEVKTGKQILSSKSEFLSGATVFFGQGDFGSGLARGAGVIAGQGLAFSPDGNRLAFGNDNTIEVWDVTQASKVQTLRNPDQMYATQVSFSADGKHLYAIINRNKAAQVWDAQTGKLLRDVALTVENANAFSAVGLSGPFFARNNADEQGNAWVEVWNLENGQSQKLATSSRSEPLQFSPDGSLLATLNDSQLYVWKSDTGQLLYRSEANFSQSGLVGLAFSPDNQNMAVASEGKAILWDIHQIAQLAQQANIPDLFPGPIATAPVIAWPTSTPPATSTPAPTSQVTVSGAILPENAARVKELSHFGAGTIEQAAWSADGDALLVAGSLGLFRYDPKNLTETESHQRDGWTYSAVALPDGRTLAAGADPQIGKVAAWDAASGATLVELDGGGEPALSPDGSLLVYLDEDGNLQVWDLARRQALAILYSASRLPRHPIFSPDGSLIAAVLTSDSSLAYNDRVRIWDAHSGAIVNALGGPDNDITDLSFSADGRYMVGAAGGSAWIWETRPGAVVASINLYPVTVSYNLNLYDHTVTAAGISPDDQTIALGTSERVIWLYDRQSHKALRKLEGHAAALTRLRFSPDGKSLLAVDRDGAILVWDMASGKSLGSYVHTGAIGGLVFRQDGNISAWQDGSAWVLHPGDANLLQTTQVHGGVILAASPSGDWLAVYDPYRVSLWDARSGAFKQTLEGEAEEPFMDYHYEGMIFRQFYGAAFSPDGSRLATAGTGGVWFYDTSNGQLLKQFSGGDSRKLAFSPDGSQLITSVFDLQTPPGILDLQSGETILGLGTGGYGYGYTQYAFSADGRRAGVLLINGDGYYELDLWDVPGGKLFKTLTFGKDVPLLSLAFNPTGSLLALGQGDGKIILLNLSDFTALATLNGHHWAVEHLAFSTDGLTLVSSSRDGTLRMWGVEP